MLSKELASFSQKLFQSKASWSNTLGSILKSKSLSVEEWLILMCLYNQSDGLTMTALTDQQSMNISGASKNVDRLAKRSLLYRQQDSADKRRVMIHLSDFGRETIETIDQEIETNATLIDSRISTHKRLKLGSMLDNLLRR